MATYETVLFDLDGTLLNTLDDLRDSVNYALEEKGFPPRTLAEIRSFVGNGIANLVQLATPEGTDADTAAQCLDLFRPHYKAHMQDKTAPYAGVLEVLDGLNAAGVKLAVVSNKFDPAVQELCPVYFGDRIPFAFGEQPGYAKKPAPDLVHLALERLGADASKAVYIGDTDVDVQTAHNAGLPCVGVTWGFRDRTVLEEAGAEVIVDSPEALLAQLLGDIVEI